MNEEIKALIDRETKEYSERIKKNTNFNSNERIAATAAFNRGANIISEAITNLFRWRKVSEELPPLDVYVLTKRKRKCDNKEYPALNKMYFEPKADKVIWEMELPDTSTTTHWMPIPEGGDDE